MSMHWKKNWYFIHRWLSLVVGVQLLAWSVGGFMFSILDIDNVHGDFEKRDQLPLAIRADQIVISPARALELAGQLKEAPVTSLRLRERFGRTVYECFDGKNKPIGAIDARTGEVMAEITEDEARLAAMNDFKPDAEISSFKYLEGEPPLEYHKGTMPVYQVIFDHPKYTHLYISPVTGDVIKRRNRPWRIFDFFFMLHVMDYSQRGDFNHLLLTGMSVFAILTSLTGLVLWGYRIPFRKRKKII